ncbi:MAG: hypothetical protein Q8O89_00055 [Nanoarchaeota archaeon]|nr:hypothetical protein [Nanoarchaeota archaeon]
MSKKAQQEVGKTTWGIYLLLILLFIAGSLAALQHFGYLDFSKLKFIDPNPDFKITPPPETCYKTLDEMGKTCCEKAEDSKLAVAVSAVHIPILCECPVGTEDMGPAPEGDYKLYRICDCNCQEN